MQGKYQEKLVFNRLSDSAAQSPALCSVWTAHLLLGKTATLPFQVRNLSVGIQQLVFRRV